MPLHRSSLADLDPLDALSGLAATNGGPAMWWHADADPHLALGAAFTLQADGPERFPDLQRQLDALRRRLGDDARLYGGFAFTPHLRPQSPWAAFGACRFTLPEATLRRGADGWTLEARTAADLDAWAARLMALAARGRDLERAPWRDRAEPDRDAFAHAVAEATAAMRAPSSLQKVVLCRRLEATFAAPPPLGAALRALEDGEPGCARFALSPGGGAPWFLGATPEWLLRVHQRQVAVDALAGTAARGLEDDLLRSAKDHHEHALVVQAVAAALEPRCDALDIPPAPIIKPLRDIAHLWTPLRGRLADDRTALQLIDALHPTPAVCGHPQDAARRWVLAAEEAAGLERGWYTGAVGWLDTSGDAQLAVALRCALLQGERATLYAGAGIVEASLPEREVRETALKMRPMLRALGGAPEAL